MRRPFVPWWRLRALPGLAWRAFREDRVFRLAALGAVLALSVLLGRLSGTPGTTEALLPAWEPQDGLAADPPALPGRPPVQPPEALASGFSTAAGTAFGATTRIGPGQPLDSSPRPAAGDRFGTVTPQPRIPGARP